MPINVHMLAWQQLSHVQCKMDCLSQHAAQQQQQQQQVRFQFQMPSNKSSQLTITEDI
jgi:hypothetical protein